MKFVFDEKKSAEAAAILLAHADGVMPTESLMTLLYLADRKSFVETGYPITGDAPVAAARGPRLLHAMGCARGTRNPGDAWSHFVECTENQARLKAQTDGSTLSDYECDTLDDVFESFGGRAPDDLVEFARGLPEWHEPRAGFDRIDPTVILEAEGLNADQIQDVAAQVEAIWSFRVRFA